ncbi:macrophage mannose receptor 1-like [Xyrichtys novacula]|uniref:Macrophage mannose receptor 1-like n=1 Tax=Xyrichtys novacula TaxID=13765 RepID=A0AAV1EIC4_XYRNO|nr:macrophage mannose receptor 1-like [Xyrichtys novacula]
MTWEKAKNYCRRHHSDLAVVENQSENEAVQNSCKEECWIGLHKDAEDPQSWTWLNGEEVRFKRWHPGEPNNHKQEEECVVTADGKWNDVPCHFEYKSVCYDDELILVKEKKTWEEALEHCRSLKTDPTPNNTASDHLYDLLHMHAGNTNLHAKKLIQNAQTQEVWIGLRFLAGHWLWVNGFPLEEQLKQKLLVCPAPTKYCGTMPKTGDQMSTKDCAERRNFFCLFKDNV